MKTCIEPGCSRPVWGKGYCKSHQYRRQDKKQKPIRQFSERRELLNVQYFADRKVFLAEHKYCEINSPECRTDGKSECVHHTKGRGAYLMDQSTWMAACKRCNNYVEQHDAWARENGFKKSKF